MQTFDMFVSSKTCFPISFGGCRQAAPYFSVSLFFPHTLQTVKVWLRLVANYGHFAWRTVRVSAEYYIPFGRFSENSQFAPNTHALHKTQVWL
jgi:hypothetical protein